MALSFRQFDKAMEYFRKGCTIEFYDDGGLIERMDYDSRYNQLISCFALCTRIIVTDKDGSVIRDCYPKTAF